ncbi:MAG: DUF4276 family protein [Planctomycetota bacterium]
MRIQPIVEGHGDVAAVAQLLRRFCAQANRFDVAVNRPHRRKRSQLVREESLRAAVRLASFEPCHALLILFDADDDCPLRLAPQIERWARAEAAHLPCAVVLAKREYEAWFLAAASSLRGQRGVDESAEDQHDPEEHRDAKGRLEELMRPGRHYVEVIDQPALTALLDLGTAHRNSRSFRRIAHAFELLLAATGAPLSNWPPADWLA